MRLSRKATFDYEGDYDYPSSLVSVFVVKGNPVAPVYLSRIRPLPLSVAKVGVITNWSQSGLQSPTEINAPLLMRRDLHMKYVSSADANLAPSLASET